MEEIGHAPTDNKTVEDKCHKMHCIKRESVQTKWHMIIIPRFLSYIFLSIKIL